MARACSKDRSDLNRDPAVQRTYRRNKAGRLESVDSPLPASIGTQGVSPILNDHGKRPRVVDEPCVHSPLTKRYRTSTQGRVLTPMPLDIVETMDTRELCSQIERYSAPSLSVHR